MLFLNFCSVLLFFQNVYLLTKLLYFILRFRLQLKKLVNFFHQIRRRQITMFLCIIIWCSNPNMNKLLNLGILFLTNLFFQLSILSLVHMNQLLSFWKCFLYTSVLCLKICDYFQILFISIVHIRQCSTLLWSW